jgi:hypothetical protein
MGIDLGNLASTIAAGGLNVDDIGNPRHATSIRVMASPKFTNTVLSSAQVPVGTIIAIAPGGLYTGYQGDIQIETGIEAVTLHYEDTTPLPISTPGTPATIAAPVYNAFQMDLIALKLRARCCWTALPGAVAYLTGANW